MVAADAANVSYPVGARGQGTAWLRHHARSGRAQRRKSASWTRHALRIDQTDAQDGLIEELDERPDPELDDERRRYYRLTDLGHRVAVAEAERLERLVKSARSKKLLSARGT